MYHYYYYTTGTIVSTALDNLGGNSSLGFVECFSSHYFCRTCEKSKEECKISVTDEKSKYRTKETYTAQLKYIDSVTKVDYKISKGVKRFCVLNNLKFYHTITNKSVCIMHDLNEGIIPFCIQRFLQYIVDKKISSEKVLINSIMYFDYGILNRSRVPSKLNLDRKNLGQNASQIFCLLIHLPYILIELQNEKKLKDHWICIQSLLKIVQIAYSAEINEPELKLLELQVEIHLESLKKSFSIDLLPKHHFLTHYANMIREMGPILHLSSMKYETKHATFTKWAKRTRNFINPNFSLATRHQEYLLQMMRKSTYYSTEREIGQLISVNMSFLRNHSDMILKVIGVSDNLSECKWLEVDGIYYKNGLFLRYLNKFLLIEKILYTNNEIYYFCVEFVKDCYNDFLNSFKIKSTEQYQIINFSDLVFKRPLEKKIVVDQFYIIADSLDVIRETQN